jgi:hypothetical protein
VRCIGDRKVKREGMPDYSGKDRRQGYPHTTLVTEMSGGNLTPLRYQLTQNAQDAALQDVRMAIRSCFRDARMLHVLDRPHTATVLRKRVD